MMTKTTGNAGPVWDAALDWLERIQAAPEDDGLQAELAAWLAQSEGHVTAFGKAEKVWRLTGHAKPSAGTVGHCGTSARPPSRKPPLRRRRTVMVAGLLAACLALFVMAPDAGLWLKADQVSGVGETSSWTLPDGSLVTLGADTAVSSAFGDERRALTLHVGEAFFEVAADRRRPFSVLAGEAEIRVTGTGFNVRLAEKRVVVAVDHGSVAVTGPPSASGKTVHVSTGQRLSIDRTTGEMAIGPIPVSRVGAWRRGQLIVEQATLAEVMERLRPYHRGMIVVTDDDLLTRRISGLYDLNRPREALRAAFQPHGARVLAVTPYLLLVTPP